MKYYDSGTSLKNDSCATSTEQLENDSIFNYNMFNSSKIYGDCRQVEEHIKSIAGDYPNLRYRIGYGQADGCHSLEESKLKNSLLTHGSEKIQLFSRNFLAGPDLASGLLIPQIESQLQQGYSSVCDSSFLGKMAEVDFDRFTPFGDCMQKMYDDYPKALPNNFSIGENSRKLTSDPEYVKKCGLYRK